MRNPINGGFPMPGPSGRPTAKILTNGQGKTIAIGRVNKCVRIKPGQPGSWISNERCTYWFHADNKWYSCRGLGDHMTASCRLMKKPPPHVSLSSLGGAKTRHRRR